MSARDRVRRPLCPQCRNTGWIVKADGSHGTGRRCPCKMSPDDRAAAELDALADRVDALDCRQRITEVADPDFPGRQTSTPVDHPDNPRFRAVSYLRVDGQVVEIKVGPWSLDLRAADDSTALALRELLPLLRLDVTETAIPQRLWSALVAALITHGVEL